MSPDADRPPERVVLIGFMGAGKTTVGRILAARLGWKHLDLDVEIERRAGRTVREIFAEEGEEGFRRREADLTREIASRRRVVVTPGGGWILGTGLLETLSPASLVVWLRVSPEQVVQRSEGAPGSRPLLAGPDRVARARALLREREPHYRRAAAVVETDGVPPDEVARRVEELLRARVRGE